MNSMIGDVALVVGSNDDIIILSKPLDPSERYVTFYFPDEFGHSQSTFARSIEGCILKRHPESVIDIPVGVLCTNSTPIGREYIRRLYYDGSYNDEIIRTAEKFGITVTVPKAPSSK